MKLFTIIKKDSSRVKRKNFQLIKNNTQLWEWTIKRLQKDNEIFINTDSEDILEKIKPYKNLIGIRRSQKHVDWELKSATLGSPVEDMYLDFCENYVADKNEIVCLFHVTSPFISYSSILKASKYLQKGYDSVQSVKAIYDFAFSLKKDQIIPINYDPSKIQRTQDLEPIYLSLGAFFISYAKTVIKSKKRVSGRVFNYCLNALESQEIDNNDELNLVQFIAKSLDKDLS